MVVGFTLGFDLLQQFVGGGEIGLLGAPFLSEFSFEGFFEHGLPVDGQFVFRRLQVGNAIV